MYLLQRVATRVETSKTLLSLRPPLLAVMLAWSMVSVAFAWRSTRRAYGIGQVQKCGAGTWSSGAA